MIKNLGKLAVSFIAVICCEGFVFAEAEFRRGKTVHLEAYCQVNSRTHCTVKQWKRNKFNNCRLNCSFRVSLYRIDIFHYPTRQLLTIIRSLRQSHLTINKKKCRNKYYYVVADENRDINGHPEDDLKRQRSQYNGDQLYSNVSKLLSLKLN